MKERCSNPKSGTYKNYGARGITVCPEWTDSFENFLRDMGPHPGSGYSIDRIDNEGDYEPGNCRWATKKTQNRNRRNIRRINFKGEIRGLAEWAEKLDLNYKTISDRIRLGWNPDRTLTAPVRGKR